MEETANLTVTQLEISVEITGEGIGLT